MFLREKTQNSFKNSENPDRNRFLSTQKMKPVLERQHLGFEVGSKRSRAEPVVVDGGSPEKRLKTMAECSFARQCSGLLNALMKTPTLDSADGVSTSRKARHVAMVKSGLADIIFKAQNKITQLLDNGEKEDSMRMEQEKETFKQRLIEEKSKIEYQLMTVNLELSKQCERDRNATRIALDRMENSAGIELNVEIEKELEILSGFSLSTTENPLHYLGLFLKDEDLDFEDIEVAKMVCCSTILVDSDKVLLTSKKTPGVAMSKTRFGAQQTIMTECSVDEDLDFEDIHVNFCKSLYI